MKITDNNQTTFGAIHIANARNITKNIQTDLQIYKITKSDREFLDELRSTIKMEELMPNIPQYKLDVWQELFNIATYGVLDTNKTGLMITNNKKPCGLMAFSPSHLDIICTWPVETGKKVPYAGTVLMKTMFEEFLKGKNNFLDLNAVTNGPFCNVAKFMRLGFWQRGGENYITAMRTSRAKIIETLKHLNEKITTREIESETVNLFNL